MPAEDTDFGSILTEAIDEALSVCGEEAKSAFYRYLEKALNIPKPEIPTRIDEFSQALEDLFGVRAYILEILVMKNLHSKLEIFWEWRVFSPKDLQNLNLKDYVSSAKKYYDASRKEEQIDIRIDNTNRVKCAGAESAQPTGARARYSK
jgi:hypothetical protein